MFPNFCASLKRDNFHQEQTLTALNRGISQHCIFTTDDEAFHLNDKEKYKLVGVYYQEG